MASGCGGSRVEAAPGGGGGAGAGELHPVAHEALCVTKGSIAEGAIREPTVRAFALGSAGDAAQLVFKYVGDSDSARALDDGELRKQVGLKLRAADSCNVVYVMWRIAPKPGLTVQVKYNPGKHTHEECGATGYIKVKPVVAAKLPALEPGGTHALRAEIKGDELSAWIDGQLAWQGPLPEEARKISGPAGLRTDNVHLEQLELHAPRGGEAGGACKRHERDD